MIMDYNAMTKQELIELAHQTEDKLTIFQKAILEKDDEIKQLKDTNALLEKNLKESDARTASAVQAKMKSMEPVFNDLVSKNEVLQHEYNYISEGLLQYDGALIDLVNLTTLQQKVLNNTFKKLRVQYLNLKKEGDPK